MHHYRIYLLDAAGRIATGRDAMCVDDEAARAAAGDLVEVGRDAEVWNGRRRVGRVAAGALDRLPCAGIAAIVANDVGSIRGGSRSMAPTARPE